MTPGVVEKIMQHVTALPSAKMEPSMERSNTKREDAEGSSWRALVMEKLEELELKLEQAR